MQFTNPPLILGIKSLDFRDKIFFSYQRLIYREIRDLETEKSDDKYFFCVFLALHTLINNDLPICGRMADWELEILVRPP